jgi:hypothetical protein
MSGYDETDGGEGGEPYTLHLHYNTWYKYHYQLNLAIGNWRVPCSSTDMLSHSPGGAGRPRLVRSVARSTQRALGLAFLLAHQVGRHVPPYPTRMLGIAVEAGERSLYQAAGPDVEQKQKPPTSKHCALASQHRQFLSHWQEKRPGGH